MDDPNITIKEYIRLEEEKARRRGKLYNWETAAYAKIWDNEDVHDFGSVETEFLAIVFNDTLTFEAPLLYEPTVSYLNNNEIDFRISFDESDDEDYTSQPSILSVLQVVRSKPLIIVFKFLTNGSGEDCQGVFVVLWGRVLRGVNLVWWVAGVKGIMNSSGGKSLVKWIKNEAKEGTYGFVAIKSAQCLISRRSRLYFLSMPMERAQNSSRTILSSLIGPA
nr:hypothetical protein [Tanacetum cinerariifolium]